MIANKTCKYLTVSIYKTLYRYSFEKGSVDILLVLSLYLDARGRIGVVLTNQNPSTGMR